MPVKTLVVENVHERNAQDLGGMSLKPGQMEEVEVSSTHYYEISANTSLKVHEETDWADTSQVPSIDVEGVVTAARDEIEDYQSRVRPANAALVAEGSAFHSAARKATQLGIDLNDVPVVDSLTGQHTLQDLVRHVANQNRPYEGIVEGGARPQTRAGEVLVEGQVANYRPESPFPTPAQDGEGKPAQEGHTLIGVRVNTEGTSTRHTEGFQKAVGSQDEYKAPAAEEEVHSESSPNHGIDKIKPTGSQETHYAVGGHMPVDDAQTVFDEYQEDRGVFEARDRHESPRTSVARGETDDPAEPTPRTDERVVSTEQENRATDSQEASNSPAGEDPPQDGDDEEEDNVTPPAREYAEENNVDLTDIEGTGSGGSVLKKDVIRVEKEREGN